MRTLERLRASASCGPIRAGTKAKTSNLPRFRSDQVPLVAREAVPHDEEHLFRVPLGEDLVQQGADVAAAPGHVAVVVEGTAHDDHRHPVERQFLHLVRKGRGAVLGVRKVQQRLLRRPLRLHSRGVEALDVLRARLIGEGAHLLVERGEACRTDRVLRVAHGDELLRREVERLLERELLVD